jgi:hypothetical protein
MFEWIKATIGICRTFLSLSLLAIAGPTIGICRTFFPPSISGIGFPKPSVRHPRFPDKATLQSVLCLEQRGERAIARLLWKIFDDSNDGQQELSVLDTQLRGEPENTRIQTPAVGKLVRPPIAERSPPQAVGGRGQARGTRPTTRLRKAAKARPYQGQSVAGIAATGGLSTRWHSYLMTDAASAPLSRPTIVGLRRLPAPRRPLGLIDRGSGRHPRLIAVARRFIYSATRLPPSRCVRAGGTTGRPTSLKKQERVINIHRSSD